MSLGQNGDVQIRVFALDLHLLHMMSNLSAEGVQTSWLPLQKQFEPTFRMVHNIMTAERMISKFILEKVNKSRGKRR